MLMKGPLCATQIGSSLDGEKARRVADRILATQDDKGGFSNFQNPDGSMRPPQSRNVNFSSLMALWLFNEVYNHGRSKLFTTPLN